MTTIHIEFPNQTHNGMFRAVAIDTDAGFPQILDLAEANNFCAAADLIHDIYPAARFDDAAMEQVMVEQQMGF